MLLLEHIHDAPRILVSAPQAEVEALAATNDTLVLEFEVFRDGRGFSLAALLRGTGYAGRLIAAGKVLPDQVRHLRRCGFDAVELPADTDPAPWRKLDHLFSAAYQPGGTDRQIWLARGNTLEALAARLNDDYADATAEETLAATLDPALGRQAVAISSFGAEAAVLLHLISRVQADLPVIFLETGQHFFQTLGYRQKLVKHLGLTDVRDVKPAPSELLAHDPKADLYGRDADACCDLRKVRPLAIATAGFDTRITGRKRYQNQERSQLKPFEVSDGTLIVNPLAAWGSEQVETWLRDHQIPRHPLVEQGYPSIGCWPCTNAVEPDDDPRKGRWSGQEKTECGIHRRPKLSPVG